MTKLPPPRHGPHALELAARNRQPGLRLPVCANCDCIVYPLRENCPSCLSDRLEWRPVDDTAELLAVTLLHHSNEAFFREQLPLRIGSVQFAAGAVAIVFVDDGVQPGDRVRVVPRVDAGGNGVLAAAAR